jgi:hypothetical protein
MLQEVLFQFGNALEYLITDLGSIDEEWKVDFFKERLTEIKKVANKA